MKTFEISGVPVRAVILRASWVMILAVVANVAWLRASAQRPTPTPEKSSSSGAPVAARTPYTVVLQESTRGSSGDVTLQSTMTMALRSDGAFLMQIEHFRGSPVIQRTIELPTGATVVVDDVRERRTSRWTRQGTSLRARMDSSRGCIKNDIDESVFPGEIVGDADLIAGYDTVKVQSRGSTFWFARQLGCANVKSIMLMPGGGTNEKVATLITPGEPDSALFSVPDRYEEVPPSVFFEMEPNSATARELDRVYFQRRPPQ